MKRKREELPAQETNSEVEEDYNLFQSDDFFNVSQEREAYARSLRKLMSLLSSWNFHIGNAIIASTTTTKYQPPKPKSASSSVPSPASFIQLSPPSHSSVEPLASTSSSSLHPVSNSPVIALSNPDTSKGVSTAVVTIVNEKPVCEATVKPSSVKDQFKPFPQHPTDEGSAASLPQGSTITYKQVFKGFCCCLTGKLLKAKEFYEQLIKSNGGRVVSGATAAAQCVITSTKQWTMKPNLQVFTKAKQNRIPIVHEQFLLDCVRRGCIQDIKAYKINGYTPPPPQQAPSSSATSSNKKESSQSSSNSSVISCICSEDEEDGLCIQCEVCKSWQHAECLGYLSENEVPDQYECPHCYRKRTYTQDQQAVRGSEEEDEEDDSDEEDEFNQDIPLRDYNNEEGKLLHLTEESKPAFFKCEPPPATALELAGKKTEIFKETDCGICLLDLDDGQPVYTLEICNHVYHLECLSRCMASRAIQNKCEKCFRPISFDEAKQINQAYIASKRDQRQHERKGGSPKKESPKRTSPTKSEKTTPKPKRRRITVEKSATKETEEEEVAADSSTVTEKAGQLKQGEEREQSATKEEEDISNRSGNIESQETMKEPLQQDIIAEKAIEHITSAEARPVAPSKHEREPTPSPPQVATDIVEQEKTETSKQVEMDKTKESFPPDEAPAYPTAIAQPQSNQDVPPAVEEPAAFEQSAQLPYDGEFEEPAKHHHSQTVSQEALQIYTAEQQLEPNAPEQTKVPESIPESQTSDYEADIERALKFGVSTASNASSTQEDFTDLGDRLVDEPILTTNTKSVEYELEVDLSQDRSVPSSPAGNFRSPVLCVQFEMLDEDKVISTTRTLEQQSSAKEETMFTLSSNLVPRKTNQDYDSLLCSETSDDISSLLTDITILCFKEEDDGLL